MQDVLLLDITLVSKRLETVGGADRAHLAEHNEPFQEGTNVHHLCWQSAGSPVPRVRGGRATTKEDLLLLIFTSMASYPCRLVFHRLKSPSAFTPTASSRCLQKTSPLAGPARLPATRNRLVSQPDLDLMAQEAEKYQDEEEADKAKFEARNGLVNHRFMSRITLTEDYLMTRRWCWQGGVGDGWALDDNPWAEKVEFESHIYGTGRRCQPDHDEGVPRRRWR